MLIIFKLWQAKCVRIWYYIDMNYIIILILKSMIDNSNNIIIMWIIFDDWEYKRWRIIWIVEYWQRCWQGWFSPGQIFVLDEYCARYGVRGCYRHLFYLSDLLQRAERGMVIDPTLIHYSFAFCASHVHGNRYFHIILLFGFVIIAKRLMRSAQTWSRLWSGL